MKILVTGGAGFIGSHTVDLLLQHGYPTRVLDNLSSGKTSNLPDFHPLLEFVKGDICNASTVRQAMEGVTHCLHLAAQVSVVASLENPQFSAQQNVIGFINVLDAAKRAGVKRLVFASSAAVYGPPPKLPLDENLPLRQSSPYGLEKHINEQYADMYRRLYDLPALGLRYFNVYGPRQDPKSHYAGVIALFVENIRNRQPITLFGNGKQSRDFIFVKDVARANVAALHSAYQGSCNVATGQETTLLGLINTLSELTGQKPEIHYGPPRQGDIAHSLGDIKRMQEYLEMNADTSLPDGLATLLKKNES